MASTCNFEIGAVAGAIAIDVLARAAETLVLTLDWLEEDGRALNQHQKIVLVQNALRSFDGVEGNVRREIQRGLEPLTAPDAGFLRLAGGEA